MTEVKVVESVLAANREEAATVRARLQASGVLALNLMSAPGSGKTTLLECTLPRLDRPGAVLVGDLQTSRDAQRVQSVAADVVQINTGRGCHLSAAQVQAGLAELDLTGVGYLFIENVGNMVCPATFDLGEHRKIALLSIPEGDDKVAKYPLLFQQADAILLTKLDLLGHFDYDLDRVLADLDRLNTRAPRFRLAARRGQGLDAWLTWLKVERQELAAPT